MLNNYIYFFQQATIQTWKLRNLHTIPSWPSSWTQTLVSVMFTMKMKCLFWVRNDHSKIIIIIILISLLIILQKWLKQQQISWLKWKLHFQIKHWNVPKVASTKLNVDQVINIRKQKKVTWKNERNMKY